MAKNAQSVSQPQATQASPSPPSGTLSPQQIVTLLHEYDSQVSQSSPLCLCVVTNFEHNQLATVRVKRLACLAFDKFYGDNYIVDPEPI